MKSSMEIGFTAERQILPFAGLLTWVPGLAETIPVQNEPLLQLLARIFLGPAEPVKIPRIWQRQPPAVGDKQEGGLRSQLPERCGLVQLHPGANLKQPRR